MNELDKAESDYTKAISFKSNYADAYNNRGVLYFNKKKYQEALIDYSKAI